MTKYGKSVLCMLLWTWGGTVYYFIEVIYKSITGKQDQISWTMLLLAIFLTISVERCGYQLPWDCPIWLQSFACSIIVTISEFIAGLILNVWLGLHIWDYSSMKFNLMGQICPQFFFIWWILCFIFIPVFDWLWWTVEGGEKPHYKI